MGLLQGSRKWDPWDPVGSDKRQKEIWTHSRLDEPTAYWLNCSADCTHCPEDWTNCPADGTNFLEARTKHSTVSKDFFVCVWSQIVTFTAFCCILNKFLIYALRRTIAGRKNFGFLQIFSGDLDCWPCYHPKTKCQPFLCVRTLINLIILGRGVQTLVSAKNVFILFPNIATHLKLYKSVRLAKVTKYIWNIYP